METELNWQKFSQDLDEAVACWLIDHPKSNLGTEFMDFADYVNRLRMEQNRPKPITQLPPNQEDRKQ